MGFGVAYDEPYLETSAPEANPSGFPQVFSVTIGTHTYEVNTSFEPYRRDAFRHRSIQSQRESIDLTNIPGEGTVNTEGLWRRSADDWHFGAGQPYQDRKGSVDGRFEESKGINPWMQWQCQLLSDTKNVLPLGENAQVLQVGKYVYVMAQASQTLKFTSDLVNWTTVTGIPPYMTMMATDGYDLWISVNQSSGDPGLYTTTAGATSASSYVTGATLTGVWWVGERLMVTFQNGVYNIIAGGALPAALWSHPNSNFTWSAMGQGSSQIYMAGYDDGAGQPLISVVYRSTIEATGTALTVPVQALPLEGGEYCTSLYGYLNFVFVGSNLGVRMCRTLAAYDPTGNQGDLEAGPLIPGLFSPGPVTQPVQAMTANNRFIYFGWSDYDNVSTGLGRMDLSTFIDTQAPAYTSDLMVTARGIVTSMDWCTISNFPIFVVDGVGVFTGTGSPVESGYIDSGSIGFGIPDDKILWAGDIGTLTPQQGTVAMAIASDAGQSGGTNSDDQALAIVGTKYSTNSGGTPNQSPFPISQIRGELFTTRMTLTRDPMTGQSPIMHRWTLKALPAITSGTTISVVLLLYGTMDNRGQDTFYSQYDELNYLENLRKTQTVVEYQEGPYSAMTVIDEIDWLPFKEADADPKGGYRGDCIVYLKSVDVGS
jgi:hypothetical protein